MRLEFLCNVPDAPVSFFLMEPDHVSAAYVGWLNDPRVNRFLESRFSRHTMETTRLFVKSMLDSECNVLLGIRSTALGGRHVGNIKLGPISREHGLGEVGIMLGDVEAWGRGIASAAIEQLAVLARDQLHLRKLSAGCYAENQGSLRAFIKTGFVLEGRRTAHVLVDGQSQDVLLLGRILRTSV